MRLTERAQSLVREYLRQGDIAVDATAGNGHDTLFLARCVGPTGRVYAFDIQSAAIESTRQLLLSEGCLDQVRLIHGSHDDWTPWIESKNDPKPNQSISAVMMNLGYLPGSDKAVTTQSYTTQQAIREAIKWLKPDGILTLLAYVGHPGGMEESDTVRSTLQSVVSEHDTMHEEHSRPGTNGPILFWSRSFNA